VNLEFPLAGDASRSFRQWPGEVSGVDKATLGKEPTIVVVQLKRGAVNADLLTRRRSVLYVPSTNLRAIESAKRSSCDAIILDLEDSVSPEQKSLARDQAVEAVEQGGFGSKEIVIRVNSLTSPWGKLDMEAVSLSQVHAILVPKINDSHDIANYVPYLPISGSGPALWAMIETVQAVLRIESIAAASACSALSVLVLGTNDLANEIMAACDDARTPLLPFLSFTIAAARCHHLQVLDGVFNKISDSSGFEVQCRQGVEFGFDGKTLIHPNQIDACNRLFSPGEKAIERAQAIIAAFESIDNRDKGIIRLGNEMFERLHLNQARRLLSKAHLAG